MAQINFNAASVKPSEALDPVPAGWYTAQITESETAPTQNNGSYMKLTFEILEGPYAKRKIFTNLNLVNANPVAQQIAYENLSAICHAVNVIQVEDSAQLHNRPLQIKASVRPAQQGGDGGFYEARNEIKGYRSVQQAAAAVGLAIAVPPAQAFVPAPAMMFAPPPVAPAAPAVNPAAAAAPEVAPAQGSAPVPPWANVVATPGQYVAAPAQPPAAPAVNPAAAAATPPWAQSQG